MRFRLAAALPLFFVFSPFGRADEVTYQKAPAAVQAVLDAPMTPLLIVNSARNWALAAEPVRNPPISDVAAPMLRIGGIRIDPKTNGLHQMITLRKLSLVHLPDGKQTALALPPGKAGMPMWNHDGTQFAIVNRTATGLELWIGSPRIARLRKIEGVRLNITTWQGLQWSRDNHTLLVSMVRAGRGVAPVEPTTPKGPHVQETAGKAGPVRTYEDMMKSPYDEALFDYYTTAQLAWVDTLTGKVTPAGAPAIFDVVSLSPDGKHIMTVAVHKPYSYIHPYTHFPREVEIRDRAGKVEYKIASLPLTDRVPIEGVPTRPRNYAWLPSAPATMTWVEALDGGNPEAKARTRDKIVALKAPFEGTPVEVMKLEQRYSGTTFGENSSLALVRDYERNKRWSRTFLVDFENPGAEPKMLWSRNIQDRYKDPGSPMLRDRGMIVNGDHIFLTSLGATPDGDRPFLDKYNLKTGETQRLFRSDGNAYETPVALLDSEGTRILTRRESPSEPPNYFVRENGSLTAVTKYPDTTPQLRGITKQLVTYKRNDGVPLSFTLYLPPGYTPGTPLPTVVWAYPREFNDADTAGQVSGSTQRFTTITGMSHLFFLLQGYAVLDNAAMPVVGTPQKVNDTYVEQIVADAKAAIEKAASMGVTDPNRVGVGGHSYGAFMTANLLAHCDLFRAGIARSGAYNRTLTPFGFQSERRTFWQATDTYIKMSPFTFANKLKEPILMIHGEADDNQGTFPVQSERMYEAIRGNGGIARLVMLPAEPHGYTARESIEHTLWEMITWFDQYVKNAKTTTSAVH